MSSDIEIARAATTQHITQIAEKIGIPQDAVLNYGPNKAKVSMDFIAGLKDKPRGKLVLENNRLTFTRNDADMLEFSRAAKTGFARPEVWHVVTSTR